MKLFGTTVLGVASLALLTACGGSTTDAVSYASLSTSSAAMQSQYTDANGELLGGVAPAATVDILAAADATYTGYVSGTVSGGEMVADLTIDANFFTNSANASATNFVHETNGAYTGTLSGTGVILPTAPLGDDQVTTVLDGSLEYGGASLTTSIGLGGSFVSSSGDPVGAIAGTADGLVGTDLMTGVFAVEK
ncbi:hypothetical protein [Celeribacter arenosi]|uniref:Transferrin-binding protein B C-lobe/N-lobe beta barrel domain-containing protein n=1 Tax=Celeribacter arenosi TaxID=792649 RepID=A0ABP7JT73_9RHOB